MLKYSNVKNVKMNKGFTLIELLVVIGIISVLSAIILPYYRVGGEHFALQRSVHALAQDLRRAQEMAMSARKLRGEVPRGGYGVHLMQGDENYRLYADINENQRFDGEDSIIETINLEKGVQIKSVSPSSLNINFRPPDPTTRISGTDTDDAVLATITLSLKVDPIRTRTISVNKAGLIAIE